MKARDSHSNGSGTSPTSPESHGDHSESEETPVGSNPVRRRFSSHAADSAAAAASISPPKPLPLPPGMTFSSLRSTLRPVATRANVLQAAKNIDANHSKQKERMSEVNKSSLKAAFKEADEADEASVDTEAKVVAADILNETKQCDEEADEASVDTESEVGAADKLKETKLSDEEAKHDDHAQPSNSLPFADEQADLSAATACNKDGTVDSQDRTEESSSPAPLSQDGCMETSLANDEGFAPSTFQWGVTDDSMNATVPALKTEHNTASSTSWLQLPPETLAEDCVTQADFDKKASDVLQKLLPDIDTLTMECEDLFYATKGKEEGAKMSAEDLYSVTQSLIDRFGSRDEAMLMRIGLIYEAIEQAFETSDGMGIVEFRGYVACVLTQILRELESRRESPVDTPANEVSEGWLQNVQSALMMVGPTVTDIAKALGLSPEKQPKASLESVDSFLESSALPANGAATGEPEQVQAQVDTPKTDEATPYFPRITEQL